MRRILSLLLLISCGLAAAEPLISNIYKPEDLPRSGYYTDVFKDPETDKDLIRYCIKTPDTLPSRRTLVLIVDFHGCGGNEESFKWVKTDYPEIDNNNLMWLGMKSQGRCWGAEDHERISKCLSWVIRTYPVDQRRIIFRGFSSGAFLQRSYGAQHQDMVAGIIQYAGGGTIQKYSDDPENLATEFYLTCGEKDKFWTSAILPESKSLAAHNYRYIVRAWDQHDHTSHFNQNDPEVAAVSKDIMLWLFALRHKTCGLYPEDMAFLKSLKKMEASEIWMDQAVVDELIRIGGAEAGYFVTEALKSKEEAIMLAAIDTCTRVNYSNAVTGMLGKLYLKDKSEAVRAASGKALCHLAAWRHSLAQAALSAQLANKKATEADKLTAVAGINGCVAPQLYGTYRTDFVMFKALILALNDDAESVRSAAIAALKPFHDNDYGYNAALDKKERRTALKGWQQWYAQLLEE